MNGIELLRELRSDTNLKQLPVVMLKTSPEDNYWNLTEILKEVVSGERQVETNTTHYSLLTTH